MRYGRALAVTLFLLLVAGAVGCSGGEDEGAPSVTGEAAATDTERREDQSRWAEQVDKACAEWQAKIDAVPPPSDEGDLEETMATVLPLIRGEVEAVKAVKPSSDDDEARLANLFIGGLERTEKAVRRYLRAVGDGDPGALENAVAAVNAAGSQTRAYAVALNLSRCGSGPG